MSASPAPAHTCLPCAGYAMLEGCAPLCREVGHWIPPLAGVKCLADPIDLVDPTRRLPASHPVVCQIDLPPGRLLGNVPYTAPAVRGQPMRLAANRLSRAHTAENRAL